MLKWANRKSNAWLLLVEARHLGSQHSLLKHPHSYTYVNPFSLNPRREFYWSCIWDVTVTHWQPEYASSHYCFSLDLIRSTDLNLHHDWERISKKRAWGFAMKWILYLTTSRHFYLGVFTLKLNRVASQLPMKRSSASSDLFISESKIVAIIMLFDLRSAGHRLVSTCRKLLNPVPSKKISII